MTLFPGFRLVPEEASEELATQLRTEAARGSEKKTLRGLAEECGSSSEEAILFAAAEAKRISASAQAR